MIYRIVYVLCRFWFGLCHHSVHVHNRALLPEGAAILCPNHTVLRDPLYVAIACGKRTKMHYMAKSELYEKRFLGWFLTQLGAYPVQRGKADIDAIRKSIAFLKKGEKLVIFPEGTRVTAGKDVEAKGGAAMLAAQTGAPIVPVYIGNAAAMFRPVELTFGEPIFVERSKEAQKNAVEQTMRVIEEMRCRSK